MSNMALSYETIRHLEEVMKRPQDPQRVASSYALRSRLDAHVRLTWSKGKRIGNKEFRFIPQREDKISFIANADDVSILEPYINQYAITTLGRPMYASGMYAQYTYLTTPE